jgi:hypothetical protein
VPGHHSYVSGEHVLRFEAVVHNTKALRCGRVLDRFPEIITRLAGTVDRFATTLDCVDVTFIGDGLLDQLPLPAQIGATRVGGVDVNKPRIRAALSAALALSTTPGGFTRQSPRTVETSVVVMLNRVAGLVVPASRVGRLGLPVFSA